MKKSILLLAVFIAAFFTAFAGPAPANDNCGGAIDITAPNATLFTTVDATASSQAAYFPGDNDDDVWFKFTANTAAANMYKVQLSNFADAAGGGFPPSAIIEIWSGCGGGATNITNTQGNVLMLTGLTTGTTYYIRVYTIGIALHANFNISVTPLTPPANDNCATAATLTPVTTCTTGEGPFTTEGATQGSQASGDGTGRDDDVWFKFTTGTTNLYGKVSLINPDYLNFGHGVIELWGNCGDAENTKFFPLTNSATLGVLAPNTTYYIRVYTYGSTSWIHTFNICLLLAPTPPPNDTYFTAASFNLHAGNECGQSVTGGTTKGATPEYPLDCGGTYQPNDVWYRFTATGVTADIELKNITLLPGHVSSNNKLWMQVFDGSNTAPVLLCSSNGKLIFDGHDASTTLIAGHTYYVRIYNDDPGNACSFDICTQVPPPPTYDECVKAVRLEMSTDESCSRGVQVTNLNATPSSTGTPSCIGQVGSDIWLKYSGSMHNLQVSINDYEKLKGSNTPQMAIAVYSGICGSLTNISCTLGMVADMPDMPAADYYIRIISYDGANQGKFTVCMHTVIAATNIDCAHAMQINASDNVSAEFVHATTTGSPNDPALKDCGGNSLVFTNSVWFKFTAAATEQLIDIQNIVPSKGNTAHVGYKFYIGADCGGDPFGCTSDVGAVNNVLTGLVAGAAYKVQVMVSRLNGDDASFDIRVVGNTPPPNNEREHAVALIEQPFYKSSLTTQGTFRFSTISPNPLPGISSGGDVWYMFKAATTNATIKVNYSKNTRVVIYNANNTVFNDPGTATSSTALTGLTIGNIYYIRLYNPDLLNATTSGAVFNIIVFGIPSQSLGDANTPGVNCAVVDGPVNSSNSNTWLHITDHGKMVMSIFDGHTGQASGLGNIGASYYINQNTIRSSASFGAYLDRNYSLIPEREPILGSRVNVIFYFSKDEFDRLVAANPDIKYLNDVGVAAFNELACSNGISSSGRAEFGLVDFGLLNADVYYFEVELTHLSSFFLEKFHGGILPVTCTDFTYKVKDVQVQLNWKTATEVNSSHFDVQRSNNSVDFATIATVDAAGNSSTPRYYSYNDVASKAGGTYYYRLKQFDKDGRFTYVCNTLKVETGSAANTLFGKIYPNPAISSVNITIQKPYTGKVTVQVINVMGQMLSQKNIEINSTTRLVTVPTANLPAGAYTLRLVTREAVYTKQFSKVQ